MHIQPPNPPFLQVSQDFPESICESGMAELLPDEVATTSEATWFHTQFVGCMHMYADIETVATYFDDHQTWFRRCAKPMKADSISKNGYALTIGRFGALGYEVEPKIGLELMPQERGVYRIQTIPVPNYTPPGYEVDFKASQYLLETCTKAEYGDREGMPLTKVEWKLDLAVGVQFPKFILALPNTLIQNTGDRLLAQIVKQVSRRLTYKVQEDFHKSSSITAWKVLRKRHAKFQEKELCREA